MGLYYSTGVFAVVLATLLSGCATLLKNPIERVPVVGPDDALISLNDSTDVRIYLDRTNQRYIELPSRSDYLLTVSGGGRRDTVLLASDPHPGFAALDAVGLFVGLAVDAVTGAWMSFNDKSIVYLDSASALRLERTEGWQALPRSSVGELKSAPTLGLSACIFANHFSIPGIHALISEYSLVSGFGGTIGMRIGPGLVAGAVVDVASGVEFSMGRSSPPLDASSGGLHTQTYQGYARVQYQGGWHFWSGIGATHCKGHLITLAGTPYDPDTTSVLAGWVPTASLGGGYRIGLFFVEARLLAGLTSVSMYDVTNEELAARNEIVGRGGLVMFTIRSGLYIEI